MQLVWNIQTKSKDYLFTLLAKMIFKVVIVCVVQHTLTIMFPNFLSYQQEVNFYCHKQLVNLGSD